MNYLEAISKITAHGLTRDQADMLVFQADDFGSQSVNGIVCEATPIEGTLRSTYNVYREI